MWGRGGLNVINIGLHKNEENVNIPEKKCNNVSTILQMSVVGAHR